MRKMIVAGNWKMNKTPKQGIELLVKFFKHYDFERSMIDESARAFPEVILFPPFLNIADAASLCGGWDVKVGAQNCASFSDGPYTGEVSASMLRSVRCEAVLIGHSERRTHFGEAGKALSAKIDQVLANRMAAYVCVGESLKERNSKKHFAVVTGQLKEAIFHLKVEKLRNIVLAYEPVWAIGTGKTASPEQAQEMHAHIRNIISKKFGSKAGQKIRILYGGSCNPGNAFDIFSQPDVDGGLIGGASLNPRDFVNIIKIAAIVK